MAQAAAAVAGIQAAGQILDKTLTSLLESLDSYQYENDDICAFWNKWEDRDQRARIERTFNNGRFSHVKRTLGFENGRWYCCLTTQGAGKKGIPLD